jgi:PqqD family protein of HPr-rel-A system
MQTLWQVRAFHKLVFKTWDDDENCIVYDTEAGDLHSIELAASHILQFIASGVHTDEAIVANFSADFSSQDQEAIVDYVQNALLQLEDSGLLVRVLR